MKRIAVTANDVLSLRHLFLESGVVRGEPVATVRSFDQEQQFAVASMQTVDRFLGQDNTERVSEFADLKFDHNLSPKCYYYCNNINGPSQGVTLLEPGSNMLVYKPAIRLSQTPG